MSNSASAVMSDDLMNALLSLGDLPDGSPRGEVVAVGDSTLSGELAELDLGIPSAEEMALEAQDKLDGKKEGPAQLDDELAGLAALASLSDVNESDAVTLESDADGDLENALAALETPEVIANSKEGEHVVDVEAERKRVEEAELAAKAKLEKEEQKKKKAEAKAKKASESSATAPSEKKVREPRAVGKKRFSLESLTEEQFTSLGLIKGEFVESLKFQPVKAQEKVINMLAWHFTGIALSVYSVISLKELIQKREVTTADLRLAMMNNPEKPYPVGTASTQAGQMVALFPYMGIATKTSAGVMTINDDSPIIKKFVAEY